MPTVVIDTGILVSAALRDRDPEKVVLWIIAQPDWVWNATDEILAEYRDVLGRPKFKLTTSQLERWEKLISDNTTLISAPSNLAFERDPKDAKFLACAIASAADYLITGDGDFSSAQRLLDTTILSVTQFRQWFARGEQA